MNLEVTALFDDELIVELTTWSGRVAAGEALVLQLLGELDARGTWVQWGALSCAHWASWRLGLTLATAREKVRVARCLRELPLLTAQLSAGQVSYAQARAITRVATAADEQRWLELARFTTAAQLEKATRGVVRPAATRAPPGAARGGSDQLGHRRHPAADPADLPSPGPGGARRPGERAAGRADRPRRAICRPRDRPRDRPRHQGRLLRRFHGNRRIPAETSDPAPQPAPGQV